MKIDVVNLKAEKVETVELPEPLFGVKPNLDLLAQAISVWKSKKYGLLTGKVKTRAEVRGGGRKPWKQKGTGRARHGSIRSPIWVGGGMAHGPKPNRILQMSKKMQRASIISALSLRNQGQSLILLDGLDSNSSRTKDLAKAMKVFGKGPQLIIVSERTPSLVRSVTNLAGVSVIPARVVNAVSVLQHLSLLITKDALPILESRLLRGTKEVEIKVEKPRKAKAEVVVEKNPSKKVTLETLELSPRSLNALHKAGFSVVSDIKKMTESDLLSISGLGKGSVAEILEALK